jgi:hypothetical protein
MRADLMRRRAELRAITGALRETFDQLRTENEALRRRSRALRDRLGQEADAGSPRPMNSTPRLCRSASRASGGTNDGGAASIHRSWRRLPARPVRSEEGGAL